MSYTGFRVHWCVATVLRNSMCVCVKLKFQFATAGNWKSAERHASSYSFVFGSLQSLPCIFSTNKTKKHRYIHLIVSRIEQKKHFNAEIRLPYSNWFDHLSFFFLPFKLFISSWSLWSNSTHPDELSRLKNSKACRRTMVIEFNRKQE